MNASHNSSQQYTPHNTVCVFCCAKRLRACGVTTPPSQCRHKLCMFMPLPRNVYKSPQTHKLRKGNSARLNMRRPSRLSWTPSSTAFVAMFGVTTQSRAASSEVRVRDDGHHPHHTALGRALGGAGAAIHTLLHAAEVGVGPTGHASRHRVVNNTSCHTRPWEPSCVEIRNSKRHDEGQEALAHTSPSGRTRSVNIPKPASPTSEGKEHDNNGNTASQAAVGSSGQRHTFGDDDPVEVVFYFETSTDAGLQGFQDVAERVSNGELPGECRNATGQGGFATWVVPRTQFMPLMAPLLASSSPSHSGGGPFHTTPALAAPADGTHDTPDAHCTTTKE